MFEGTHVAIVTPFRDGRIDHEALTGLVSDLLAAGVDGLVPCGTTGESPTLSETERDELIGAVVKLAAGRAKVIAGTGCNDTARTVDATRRAAKLGADGALLIAPYYNKPTQEGLYRHFAEVARHSELPLVLYNAPGRSGVEIAVPTIARLREEFANVAAVKHATGSVDGASALRAASPVTILSGDDSMTLPLISVGAEGVISVIANIAPKDMVDMVRLARTGEIAAARRLHEKMFPLASALLSLETNPIPIKAAMALSGRMSEELRLPLCPMSDAHRNELRSLLTAYGLLPTARN
jgi:4-hydroxy-tetrahydrodipicolinate synthase